MMSEMMSEMILYRQKTIKPPFEFPSYGSIKKSTITFQTNNNRINLISYKLNTNIKIVDVSKYDKLEEDLDTTLNVPDLPSELRDYVYIFTTHPDDLQMKYLKSKIDKMKDFNKKC